MDHKHDLIDIVIEYELDMFLSAPADGPYNCRDHPDQFRMHRRAQFSTWSHSTLESYRQDLIRAKAERKNLMTLKYARMNDQLPKTKTNPVIEKIFVLQYRWQQEMFKKYPHLMGGARALSAEQDSAAATSFETYMKSELETYSDNTLSLLFQDLEALDRQGVNGSERVYEILLREMGYDSIEAVERLKRKRASEPT